MNAHIAAGLTTAETTNAVDSSNTESSTTFGFCGKGLHYDWRAIVAASEAAHLDAELAQMSIASTRS
jgi:hypothetical protein